MKISLNWLKDYLDLRDGVTPAQLAAGLVQLGHEVDAIADTASAFANVVIGRIKTREQHPNADRLGVCMVDVGEKELRQIVCGAPNARAGITVAVALPGAVLPGDFAIKESAIRSVESRGMICSERELGFGDEHNGIWELDNTVAAKAKSGAPLMASLGRGDVVLDVAVTPNRGDCLSHLGIARELAALGFGTFKAPKFPALKGKGGAVVAKVSTADCGQLNLLRVSGVKAVASPAAVQARLEAAGIKPKNALVDVTNYVMLALGQPMHAYDAAKVKGGVYAAAAKGGETFDGIGDVKVELKAGDIAMCDDAGVVGLGGVLGGSASAVSEGTTEVILEAAYFDRVRISLTGQAHKLVTDARSRFERGVDPALTQDALRWAASLLVEWCGGEAGSMATAGEGVVAPVAITYTPDFARTFGGLEVAEKRQQEILATLGFGVKAGKGAWVITPPTYRTYMQNPEDIVEEILRVEGYEKVVPVMPAVLPGQFAIDGAPIAMDRKARKALAAAGFLEAMTYSFIGRDTAELFADGVTLVDLDNPLAQTDMTTMRPSLLPGLLAAVQGNFNRSEAMPRVGEVGKVYHAKGERLTAAGVLAHSGERHWRGNAAKPDVFAAKAAAWQALELLGAPVDSGTVTPNAGGYYHPGKSGVLKMGPFVLAKFGELHPAVVKKLKLDVAVAVFELELEPVLKMASKTRPFTPALYPPVKRDLAFILPAQVEAGAVLATLKQSNRDVLKRVDVFDVYQGERLPGCVKSVAFSLTLQAADRTLAEAEIVAVVDAAVAAVDKAHGGKLRA